MTDNFYSFLTVYDDFLAITESANFTPVPRDWYVALSDVRQSTEAVRQGRYKEVNLLGASTIIALLNIAGSTELPFLFSGDGSTILLPPSLVERAQAALVATQEMAHSQFGLDLRVGLIPVSDILAAGHDIRIAKLRISENYEQAMFTGGGLAHAERLLKEPTTGSHYRLAAGSIAPHADFSGLECRWKDIPSQHGETISLIVLATTATTEHNKQVYRAVLGKIAEFYGTDADFRPVSVRSLRPAFNRAALSQETKLRGGLDAGSRLRYFWRIWLGNILLRIAVRFRLKLFGVQWTEYLNVLEATSDYKKYDDTLRMILSGTAQQRERLTSYLETQHQRGDLAYGLHISNRALMTCLVFERMGRQVHFVDGADGGYALAAYAMKEQLRARQQAGSPV